MSGSDSSTIEAIRALPTSSLWAIGTYRTRDGLGDFRITHDDFETDTEWAVEQLRAGGVERGGHVVVISGGWEAPWFWPVACAAQRIGAVYSACDGWPFDAHRTELFLRRLPVTAVIGVNEAVASTLAQVTDLNRALSGLRLLAARPDAVGRLRAAGLSPVVISPLGPALAFGRSGDSGVAGINTDVWRLDGSSGSPVLTTVADRGHRLDGEPQLLEPGLTLVEGDGVWGVAVGVPAGDGP